MRSSLNLILIVILIHSCSTNPTFKLRSPNGRLKADLIVKDTNLVYSVVFNENIILKNSFIQFNYDSLLIPKNFSIVNISKSTVDDTWQTVNGKNKIVRNHYNEYLLHCSGGQSLEFDLVFRCYDKGFAFRYSFPDSVTLLLTDKSMIEFDNDFIFWAYNGEMSNIGSLKVSENTENVIRNPVVLETPNGKYLAIHEAAVFNHAPFILKANKDNNSFNIEQTILCKQGQSMSSWRAVIFGDTPGDLIESNLLVNLNQPCKIEDVSWIVPGKSMWDWRVWGYKTDDGFEYGLNTTSHKRFIDFASENNIQYLLIDADWYGPEFDKNSDPTRAKEGVDIEECIAYANGKGIGIILYLNDVGAKKFGLERVLKQFSDWGAVGVKYGFMKGNQLDKVLQTRKIVELCAQNRLMVNFHDDPVAPSGDRRTWPNLVTREFCHAQADAKRSSFPEDIVTSVFVNMIAGPLDMANGWFDLNNSLNREKVFEEIPSTVTAEVAKLIVVYSGWCVLPDAPEEYLKKEDLFDCIRNMPGQFDSFKILDGKIGEYITVARGSGSNWFVGSLTNQESRQLDIKLDFLEKEKTYKITLYEDTDESHFQFNKEVYQIKEISNADKNSVVSIKMAPGGGHCMWIRPE